MNEPSMLDHALACIARGWAVFPCHSIRNGHCTCEGKVRDCKPGKHPRTPNGVKGATTDPEKVRKWWKRWPAANIGIATGRASGLMVLDVDGTRGEGALRAVMESLGVRLPETAVVRTGRVRGFHLYFTLPPGGGGKGHKPINALSLQGDGQYVIAPGSLHESGKRYTWERTPELCPVAPIPNWLLNVEWQREAKRADPEGAARPPQPPPPAPNSQHDGARLPPAPLVRSLGPFERAARSLASQDVVQTNPKPTREGSGGRNGQARQERQRRQEGSGWCDAATLVTHLRLTGPIETDGVVLSLARGLKIDLGLSWGEALPFMRQWHTENAGLINHEHEWAVMEMKCDRAWGRAVVPLRFDGHAAVWERAAASQLTPDAARFEPGNVQRTVQFLAHLQAVAPGVPLVLSGGQLAGLLGHSQRDTARDILRGLEQPRLGPLLRCTRRGDPRPGGRASEYVYLGALPTLTDESG